MLVGGALVQKIHAAHVGGYVMHLQMVPAICVLDSARSKKRQCLDGYALNIAGLYPSKPHGQCSTESSAKLGPLQSRVLSRVMPDEKARIDLWRNIGGCVPMSAVQYFRLIIQYAGRLKVPAELSGIERNQYMRLPELRSKFIKLNKGLTEKSIQFECRSLYGESLLTGAKVCYTDQGAYRHCADEIIDQCPQNITIKGSF